MEPVVARWEWRIFSEELNNLHEKTGVEIDLDATVSIETYIIQHLENINVKIRAGILDVKKLAKTDENCLEQWSPIYKQAFPIQKKDLDELKSIIELENFPETEYPVSEINFIDLIRQINQLRNIKLEKKRTHFIYRECIAEFAKINFENGQLETFSLEHSDPNKVMSAIATLGMNSCPNTNYPTALREFLKI